MPDANNPTAPTQISPPAAQPMQASQEVKPAYPPSNSWLPVNKQPITPPPPLPPPHQSSLGLMVKLGIGLVVLILLLVGGIFFVGPFLHPSSGSKVILTYWGIWEDKKTMQPVIEAFEKKYPNITVDYQQQDLKQLEQDNQPYPKRLIARINAGTGPDIFRYHNTWYPMLSGVLAPLSTDVVSAKDFSSTYFPVVSRDVVHNGAIYGIPIGFDTLSLFVNPDIFQSVGVQVPSDWNDFQKVAADLTSKDDSGTITTSGAALGSIRNINHAPDIVGLLLADSGIDVYNFANTSANAAAPLQYFMQFTHSANATWDETLPMSLQMFAKGNLAMYLGYSWDILNIKAINPKLTFTTYPMPSLYGVQRSVASYWVEGVSLHSAHPKEAMLFMHFLNQKDTQQQFYASAAKQRGFGEPYARKDLADSLKSNKLLYPFVQQGESAVSTLFIADTFDGSLNESSNQYLSNALSQISTSGSTTDAVNTLSSGIQQVLSQYGH